MNQTALTTCRATLRRGFTLIELLVVIAVTAVLFALLIIPLVSALRYTHQAQIVTAAQDAARVTKERLTRELNSAVFVFDGTSHPFRVPAGTTPASGDDRYTNFLDLQVLNKTGGSVVAHAYNAKLDFVLPKLNDTGAAIDPTTNEPIAYRQTNGSAVIGSPSYIFPLAAGTNAIRYYVGLKDPTNPYNNIREGKSNASDDNTYILYRAQFQPYVKNTTGTGPGVIANSALFATRDKLDAAGNPVLDAGGNKIQIPEIDDPDFFRYVTTADTNWLNDTHGTYTAAEVTAHNKRVDTWRQIAKPVIPGPNVDLLLLPHNADNTLNYDPAGGTFPGVAHSGVAHDPVTAANHPVVNTSVTFRPATVSGDATPGTTGDYTGQGVITADQSGFTYVPTVYTATSQSWSLPYHVTLYPNNFDATNAALSMYYETADAPGDVTVDAPNNLYTHAGDVLEYRDDAKTGTQTLVYNVTQDFAIPVTGSALKQYVPMNINPDTGTINFAAPSLPKGYGNRFVRQWNYAPAADGTVDLTQPGFTDQTLTTVNPNPSPLTAVTSTPGANTGVENARIVPGSVRVSGPETGPGASNGNLVSYTEVNLNSSGSAGIVGEGQFSVDYAHNRILLKEGLAGPVAVVYDYQANMTLTTPVPTPPGTAIPVDLTVNLYLPMQVKVDYQTRDLIDVTIGVRIYDITTNRAQVIPAETKIKIGNSNR